jgi:hypothetical protein
MDRLLFAIRRLAAPELIGIALTLLVVIFMVACSDDDDDASPGTGSVSASGPVAEPGVVQTKPASATQVDVVLREWSVTTAQASVPAGQVYFLVDNQGPEDPHEFVVIRSDLAPAALPVENGMVPESRAS